MREETVISVLMSVYNTDFAVVKRAIDSVLRQSYQSFELIIVDDGSDHDDDNQLLRYARQHEEKITFLRHKNRGQSGSINQGVLLSRGQYIAIIDADDEYKPEHLQACLKGMEEADLIASTTQTITDQDADYYVPDRKDGRKLIHVDDCILFATFFGRKEVFSTLQFQDAYAADAHFYERASERYRVKKLDLRTYVYYRNNPDSICSVLKNQYFSDQLA